MYLNDVETLPPFSGLQRVVGAWLSDVSVKGPDASKAAWFLMGRCAEQDDIRVIAIRVSPFRIGRDREMDLSIASPTVSRIHAEIVAHDGRLRLRDLSSRNGTYVNGRRVRGSMIIDSDAIMQFASVPFRVCLMPETGASMT
jgi:hypothetical protein